MKILNFILIATLLGCSTTDQDTSLGHIKSDKMDALVETEFNKPENKKATKETSIAEKSVDKIEIKKTDYSELEEKFEQAVLAQKEDQLLSSGSEMLAKNPENPDVLNGFGTFYLRAGDLGAAKIYFERALVKDPKNANANNGMGVVTMKEGSELEGQQFFKKALQADDDHAEANANLGAYYLKYLDYEKAEIFLSRAYSEDRRNAVVANNYAISLRGIGKYDKALDIYKSIDSKNLKIPVLLNQAILLAEFKKDYGSAKEILNKIRFITTDPAILKKVNTLVIKMDTAKVGTTENGQVKGQEKK